MRNLPPHAMDLSQPAKIRLDTPDDDGDDDDDDDDDNDDDDAILQQWL